MANIGAKLQISPEIIQKLSSGKGGLWVAAHQDGSDNRINGEAIMDAAACSTFLGILTGIFQGLKKAFRNRGKTKGFGSGVGGAACGEGTVAGQKRCGIAFP